MTKAQKQFSGGRIVFSTHGAEGIKHPEEKKISLDLNPTPYIKLHSKCAGLNVKTIKLTEENIQGDLQGLGFGEEFLGMTPKAQSIKINTLEFLNF